MMNYSIKSVKILFAVLLVIGFASCKKENFEVTPISAISFVNASASSPNLGVYIGGNKVQTLNNDPFNFGTYYSYSNAYSGEREISFNEGADKKITGKVTLVDGMLYSVFLAGKWPQAEIVLLEDKLSVPATGKANIRFVNMGQDAGTLDLTNGTTVISSKAYKAASEFIAVDVNSPFNFSIKNSGSADVLVTMPAVSLEMGRNYTIWAKGLKAGTGADALGIGIIKNY